MSKCAEGKAIAAWLLALLVVGCGAHPGNSGGAGGEATAGSGGESGGSGGRAAPDADGGAGARGDGGRTDAPAPADAAAEPDPDPPDAAHFDFCDGYAAKFCQRLQTCSPPYLVGTYGDLKTCQDRLVLACATEAALPGTGLGKTSLGACADALGAATCDDLFAGTVPACQPKGTLATGAACGSSVQCASGFCRTPETSFCGKCDVRAAEGAACDSDDACQFPLACSESGRCARPSAEGEFCNETKPCKSGALFCASDNTCKRPSAEGKACNRSGNAPLQPCDIGFSCRPSANGVCRAIRLVATGMPCGVSPSGSTVVLCAGSGSCVKNVCQPPGDDGQVCTVSPLGDSGGCLAPALCLEGRCKLPDPASRH